MEDGLERKALGKWYLIFASGQDAWPEGFDLRSVIVADNAQRLGPVCETKRENRDASRTVRVASQRNKTNQASDRHAHPPVRYAYLSTQKQEATATTPSSGQSQAFFNSSTGMKDDDRISFN